MPFQNNAGAHWVDLDPQHPRSLIRGQRISVPPGATWKLQALVHDAQPDHILAQRVVVISGNIGTLSVQVTSILETSTKS